MLLLPKARFDQLWSSKNFEKLHR